MIFGRHLQRPGTLNAPHSPVEAADHDVAGEAHPPPELQAAVAELSGQSAGLQLGHGRQLRHVVTFDVQGCKTEEGKTKRYVIEQEL